MKVLWPSKICAVIAAPNAEAMRKQLSKALRLTRMAELRLDWLLDDRQIRIFLRHLATSRPRATLIVTCRREEAGGQYGGTIAEQFAHLTEAIRAGCEWYDLEIETVRKRPPELRDALLWPGRRLTSAHFFQKPPADLTAVAAQLAGAQSDAIKIAAQCNSLAESRKLLKFAETQRNIVAVPMGDVALPMRFLALRKRNEFAYAPVENSTAPGQISLDEMKRIYRADQIDARTRVYGVIGDPIAHSLSPVMQNAGFAARRVNAVYLPFLIRDLRDFVDSVEPLGIKGFSVTLPHKERILRFLHRCDPLAAKIGAVNTVVVRSGGKLHGYNTDYVGVLQTLERRITLRGSRVLIVGAGGAARAVAFALAQAGAAVCVTARRLRPSEASRAGRGRRSCGKSRVAPHGF